MDDLHWPNNPKIFELNAWLWLNELSNEFQKKITLKNIPEQIIEKEIQFFDAVWLMGVWTRSHAGRMIAINHQDLQKEFRNALKDYNDSDVIGSPYAVYEYKVEKYLGGIEGILKFRQQLKSRNIKLILDFVPNHVAIDHPWVNASPECFIKGSFEDLTQNPNDYFRVSDQIIANGKDPYFPSWTDTAQLNAFSQEYRNKAVGTILEIANLCDGIRCDMAMLATDLVFHQTWGDRSGDKLEQEFWVDIIGSIKKFKSEFKFIAEVYWDMEWVLQQQGFDFCYDKKLFDRLINSTTEDVNGHLNADIGFQSKLLRFIENHDENRSIDSLGVKKSIAAAVVALNLPGARLIHQGQTLGRSIKIPLQLGRLPNESINLEISKFYKKFLPIWRDVIQDEGIWKLIHSDKYQLISYLWSFLEYDVLILVNYSDIFLEGILQLKNIKSYRNRVKICEIIDVTRDLQLSVDSNEFDETGIPYKLNPWDFKLIKIIEIK